MYETTLEHLKNLCVDLRMTICENLREHIGICSFKYYCEHDNEHCIIVINEEGEYYITDGYKAELFRWNSERLISLYNYVCCFPMYLGYVKNSYLKVSVKPKYWEDSVFTSDYIPCVVNDRWELLIDISTGVIINWPEDVSAHIHFKICDDGIYTLLDGKFNTIHEDCNIYVPDEFTIEGEGFGDYMYFNISSSGEIENWGKSYNIKN